VNGLYRHGFMIAPEVADTAAQFAEALLAEDVSAPDSFDDFRRQARWSDLLHSEHVVPAL
jgi:glycine oxidase